MNPQSESSSPPQTSRHPTTTTESLLSLDLSKTLHLPVEPRPNCCDICGRYFSRYDNLERHRRTHLNQKLFECEECGKSFSQKSHLNEHSTVHTGEHPYKCHICGLAFSRRGNLSRHMKTHKERPLACAAPSSVITTATLLRKATTSISDGGNNVLGPTMEAQEHEEVDVMAEDPDALGGDNSTKAIISAFSRHHRKQHGDSLDINSDNPFGCKACWRAFSQGSQNTRNKVHERIHTALKPFKCDLCPKSFSQKSHLKVHRRIHTGEKPFSCSTCPAMFSRNDHLERHMRTHHGPKMYRDLDSTNYGNTGNNGDQCNPRSEDVDAHNDKDIQPTPCCSCCCDNSSKQSVNNSESSNIRPDPNCRNNNIDNCSGNQTTATQNGHIDSSSEGDCDSNKPLDCSLCFKAFFKRSHESMHKKIHQAVLPFKCNVCGKAFPQNGNLTRHKRTHVGEKRFHCDICGKSFSQKSHVKVHELIHIGDRPYKCDDCGYSFRRHDHLMRHKEANAGKSRLSCIPRRKEGKLNSSVEFKEHVEEHNTQTDTQLNSQEQGDIQQVDIQHQNSSEQPLSLVQQVQEVPLNLHTQPADMSYYNNVSVAANLVNVQPNQTHHTSLPLAHTSLAHHVALSHHSLSQISALPPQHLNIPFHPNLAHPVNVPLHPGY